ncbi:MAG: exosortase/archaeosortase family protein [Verrucomicrobiaceae bacterium]|nr:MAG: exosortase/archaeosortase family protein [Verrucomicrobiaceae bacterium]
MAESPSSPQTPISFSDAAAAFGRWCARRPWDATLLFGVLGTLVYYFGFYGYAMGGAMPTAQWAAEAWNEGNDLEHGFLIFPAAVVVAWMHRDEIAALPKRGSWKGLFMTLWGVLLFLVGVWTAQPRIVMVSLPVLIFGGVWFVWGWPVARKIAFPCVLLLFMVPIGFILNHTEPLQRLVANVVHNLCSILGLGIERDGVRLFSSNPRFECEVAGGCSGIRSLMAMSLLSAVYVHFTQKEVWKKVLIFAFALPFAVVGNIARVFTIVLFAKYISVSYGTGAYHDISGFLVTIPIALWGMVQFGNLLSRDWKSVAQRALAPEVPVTKTPGDREPVAASNSSKGPISYDY